MSRKKFFIFTLLTFATFGFAVFMESGDKFVKAKVVAKSEIPEHYESIDKGTLPYEQKYIKAKYFVTLSFHNRTEKIAVDRVTFDKAVIGKILTIKK